MIRMNQPIPLRETTVWGGYRERALIPHRYGNTGGKALQYDATRTLFVWADHACVSVDSVTVGGVEADAWDYLLSPDSTGRTVTFIRFNEAVDEGAEVFAIGRGKMHQLTGVQLATPGAIAWDILTNLCGWGIEQSRFGNIDRTLRYEAGGSLDSTETVQTILRSLADSFGMLFAIDSIDLLYPFPPIVGSVARTVIDGDSSGITLEATADDATLTNDLTLQFNFYGDVPQQAVRLHAPDSLRLYGSHETVVQARWLVAMRDAIAVGQRRLAFQARPQWDITIKGVVGIRSIGDLVTVDHPLVGVGGTNVVRSREIEIGSNRSQIELSIPAGDIPTVEVVQQSAIYAPNSYINATVVAVGTDRVITLTEADGTPLDGAAVTLTVAGQATTRYTDSRGIVSFPAYLMPGGASYLLHVVKLDGTEFDFLAVVP